MFSIITKHAVYYNKIINIFQSSETHFSSKIFFLKRLVSRLLLQSDDCTLVHTLRAVPNWRDAVVSNWIIWCLYECVD